MLTLLYSQEYDVAAVSSGRLEGVSTLVVSVEHALEAALGSSTSSTDFTHNTHSICGSTEGIPSREALLASLYFPPISSSTPLKEFTRLDQDVDDTEEADAHLRFASSSSSSSFSSSSTVFGNNSALNSEIALSNSRQRTFLAQPEVATNLLVAASNELTLLIEIEKGLGLDRALGSLSPILLRMLQHK